MQITVDLPEDLIQHADPALEALAIEAIVQKRSRTLKRRVCSI